MDDPTSTTESDSLAILHILDQVLLRHLERITGTSRGIQGLPMDLLTVTCIVLLMENSGEETDSENPGTGLDRQDFEEELKEMGLGDPDMLRRTLEGMASAGYIDPGTTERIVPEKPAYSMARLLEHAFPGMPGMNLVAYFVQTLDEVETGRKTPADALGQLDQMLRRHGAAPFRRRDSGRQAPEKEASPPSHLSAPASPVSRSATVSPGSGAWSGAKGSNRVTQERLVFRSPRPSTGISDGVKAPSLTQPMPEESLSAPSQGVAPPSPAVPTDVSETGLLETRNESPSLREPPEITENEPPPVAVRETSSSTQPGVEYVSSPSSQCGEPLTPSHPHEEPEVVLIEPQCETTSLGEPPETTENGPIPEPVPKTESSFSADAVVSTLPATPMPPSDPLSDADAVDPEIDVDEQIAAFEETLAMQCPVCREASVKARKTAKGRVYYQCASEQCMFISWGLPHHIPCPRCGNPFLVEAASESGENYLKCPRATCRYQAPLGTDTVPVEGGETESGSVAPPVLKAKRRVVRRRVVRRKR